MAHQIRSEPNIGTRVCVKEKEALTFIWLYVREVMADEVTLPTKTSHFLGGGGFSLLVIFISNYYQCQCASIHNK